MILDTAQVVGGLLLLFLGGGALVRGAVALARQLGISPLFVGLVVVGFGTSMPELVVSLEAALKGSPDVAVGNVVGSNIANILLILGASALVYPIRYAPKAVFRDSLVMLACCLFLAGLTEFGVIETWMGAAMVASIVGLIGYSYWSEKYRGAPSGELHVHEAAEFEDLSPKPWLIVATLGGGFVCLVGGANMLIVGAVDIARSVGISEGVIGLTLVALGTSLPELATSMIAALRKHSDIAVGNVLGSNIFNILSVLGLTAVVTPIPISAELIDDAWIMAGVAVLLFSFLVTGWRVTRLVGALFLICYGGYVAWLYDAFPTV